jgi:hypothetical protein
MTDELTPPAPALASAPAAQPSTLDLLFYAIHGQESSFGQNPSTSSTGARGDMQIEPATFAQFAQPGESIDNRDDNLRVGRRILGYYLEEYQDPARAAVAYFSGPGNVSPPGSPYPFLHDFADPSGKTTSSYVQDVTHRMGYAAAQKGGVGPSPNGANDPLVLSRLAPQPGPLEPFNNAIEETAQKQQQQAVAAPQPRREGPLIQPPPPGPLGLTAQPVAYKPPPTQMEHYLALLRAGRQPEAANG